MSVSYSLELRQDDGIIPEAAEEWRDGFIIQINVSQTVLQQQLVFLVSSYNSTPRKYDSQLLNMDRHLLLSDHHNLHLFMSNILNSHVLLPPPMDDRRHMFRMLVRADLIGDDSIPVRSPQALTQLVSTYAWLMANNSRNSGRRLLPLVMDFKVYIIHSKALLFSLLQQECPICQEELASKQEVVQLSCSHDFHEDCILRWQETTRFCPVCNLPC